MTLSLRPSMSASATRALLAGLAALALAACAADPHAGHAGHASRAEHAAHGAGASAKAPAADPLRRTVVEVSPEEYRHVIGDMQNLLRATGEIQGALVRADWDTVGRVAGALRPQHTMGSRDPAAASFHARLPAGWSERGGPMHQGFARIADEAAGARRTDEVLRTLSATTAQCVACHAQFQLRLSAAAGGAR